MNPSEKATLNFYNWEYRHRGYYQFDTPIDIEIPYVPFQHSAYTNEPIIDDGRVPSLIQSFTKLLAPQKQEVAIPQEVPEVEPRFLAFSEQQNLVGVSISFPKDSDILPSRNLEFLNMLSFTEHLLSFEIAASYKEIEIQIVCSEEDNSRVFSQLQAYFPLAIIRNIEIESFGFSNTKDIAIADFGLNDEFMRPIATIDSFSIDPLTSVIATMETLLPDDVAVFQVLFKGITSPIAKDIPYSVSDGSGGSFFADAPEMVKCAQDKIATPLFAVVIRIATQGNTDRRSQYLAQELARSISAVSTSEYNKLIPLSNEGYAYDFHQYNLHHRLSNRLGCILNSKELNTFLHYPNKTIVSKKLGLSGSKTKRQSQASNKGIYIGENSHNRESFSVHLDTETRLSHTHILGVTGVGKSTLIAQMFLRDVEQGLGCAIFDPHGDICDDILKRIPENRKEITKHRSLQDLVHTLAIQRGFKSVIEEPTKNGGRVDVGLTKEGIRIGIEISITNTKEYEAKNLIKCIESGYTNIVMICVSEVHLKNIKNHIKKEILKDDFKKIDFVLPKDINTYLDAFNSDSKVQKERIQGYRVNTSYRDEIGTNKINKQQELTNLILSSMRSKKKKK